MPLFPALPTPAIISNEAVVPASNSSTTMSVANRPLVYAFEVYTPTVILGGRWFIGGTATGKTNMAIYTLAGNLVSGSDSGQITNVASQDNTFTYTTPVTLAPGQYLMAIGCSNTTDTYAGRTAGGSTLAYRTRIMANSIAAGAMPSTTGALTVSQPSVSCSLTVQGGL